MIQPILVAFYQEGGQFCLGWISECVDQSIPSLGKTQDIYRSSKIRLDFRYVAPFRNPSASKVTGCMVENRSQILHLFSPIVKIMVRVGEMSESGFKFGLAPNF